MQYFLLQVQTRQCQKKVHVMEQEMVVLLEPRIMSGSGMAKAKGKESYCTLMFQQN